MITKDRTYRNFEIRAESEENIVTGYAAVFEKEAVLYEYDGVQYKEIIDRDAFRHAAMSDVVMNYNHTGKPVARTKNGTLSLTTDETGLKVRADLSGTEEGRKLYEEIRGGYIDQMSFAFIVADQGDSYDRETHTRRINQLQRIFDVAAVDIPAYNETSISARSFFKAEAEKELAEARERLRQKQKIRILCEVAK